MPIATTLVTAAALTLGLAAGSPQQPPAFRSSVDLVEVDVIVRDRDGRFVTDLKASDLELYENGELQRIVDFYLVRGRDPVPAASLTEAPDPRSAGRRFVFVFDERHLSRAAVQRLRQAAVDFVAAHFQPGDYGGVFHDGGMANGRLTSLKAEVVASLKRVTPASETRARRLALFREFPRIDGEHEATRIEAGDTRTLENAAQENCLEEPDLCSQEGGAEMVEHRLEQKAREYIAESRAATARVLQSLTMVARGLAGMPGRKTVIFLSDGFFVEESRAVLRQIAALAARNGVTIYGVDGRGSAGGGRALPDASSQGRSISTAFDTAEDGPAILAAETGGFVVRGSDNFRQALGRIAEDTSTYYVVGYQPAAFKLDGKLRKIEVRVKEEGVRVRARKGYLATPLPPSR